MTTLAVVGVVIAAGLLAYGVMFAFARRSTPLDTEREERWFVIHAPEPLRRAMHDVDRRVVGGAALALLFVIVLFAATAVGWIFDTIDENRGSPASTNGRRVRRRPRQRRSTRVLEAITQFGATGWLLIVMAVIGVVEAWHFRKPAVLGYLAAVGIGVSLINNGLKHMVSANGRR